MLASDVIPSRQRAAIISGSYCLVCGTGMSHKVTFSFENIDPPAEVHPNEHGECGCHLKSPDFLLSASWSPHGTEFPNLENVGRTKPPAPA